LFVFVVYVALVGSKHENKSLFQNLATNIAEVQALRAQYYWEGIFIARTVALPDTIDTNDLCELLQAHELVETKQLSAVAQRQNRDANVSG
jgi:hypothetical protein